MSFQAQSSYKIPDKTTEIAHTAFPVRNLYLKLLSTLGACLLIRILLYPFPKMDNRRSRQ
jgi:hypothetical protein